MDTSFEPRNDLETSLLDAQEGRIAGEQFMQTLLESQVYMPIYEKQGDAIGNIQLDNKAKPLSIKAENGEEFLILFTSPERSLPIFISCLRPPRGANEGALSAGSHLRSSPKSRLWLGFPFS